MWLLCGKKGFVRKQKVPPIMCPLRLTLEDLYNGVDKMVTFTRSGATIHEKFNLCDNCNSEALPLKLPPGTLHGEGIVYERLGIRSPGMIQGDLICVVEELPHPVFERRGFELFATKKIAVAEVLTQDTFTIETLDNRSLTISKPQSGHVIEVPNEGMPNANFGVKGSLFVRFEVVLPNNLSLTDEEKDDLKKLLTAKGESVTNLESVD